MSRCTTLLCPGCYALPPSTHASCPACGAALWIDNRLALASAFGKHHPNAYRGWLRDPASSAHPVAVAVKVFDLGAARDWREHDRFAAQRELLHALDGLRVPRPLGDFERGGRLYHCQTLLEGRPLGTQRPVEELVELAAQLLLLVDEMHRRGVVHRDLKPEHLLVDDVGRVQLIDFGAARRLDDLTDDGVIPTVVGSPGYMAPEQLLGEWGIASDLYAIGRVLEHALAGRTAPRLSSVIREMTQAQRHKRPRSGAHAAELLAARRGLTRWLLLAAPLWCGLVFALSRASVPQHATVLLALDPSPSLPSPSPSPSPPSTDDRQRAARALLAEWERAQNAHDLDRYSALYADAFVGILKTANGATRTLDRQAWLVSRGKMFVPTLQIAADNPQIVVDAETDRVTLTFVQRFRTTRYADHGKKEIVLSSRAGLSIVGERMIESRLGWDEADQRRRFPAHGATCDVAFDPSQRRFLVALGHFDDYRDALRSAGAWRQKDVPVELVCGDDFAGLEPGFWLLAGASDDEAQARMIAKRTHGTIWRVGAAPARFPSVLRLTGERLVRTTPSLVTTSGTVVYLVNREEVLALALRDDQLVESFRVPMPAGTNPIRVAVRDGHAYVLDAAGHWSLLSPSGVVRTRAFDPEPEGHVAIFGPHRFELEADSLVYRRHEGEAHRLPLLSGETGIWRLGGDRLLLLRRGSLFLFTVGPTPRSLSKVCGAIRGELTESAHVTVGEIDLDTDREGGFELWSSQWGFYAPALEVAGECASSDDDCSSQSTVTNEVGLFGQQRLEIGGEVRCECGGC